MEELRLVRVGERDEVFHQYLPGNMHGLLKKEKTVCVGAVFRGKACGAALAERTDLLEYHLRYIFVDPLARLCGVGTYLLRGLLGEVSKTGVLRLNAVYAPSMLENGGQKLGILERAGFSAPKAAATAFSTQLGAVRCPEVRLSEGMAVYTGQELPEAVIDEYETLVEGLALPQFVDPSRLKDLSPELSSFCCVNGQLAGILLVDRVEGGLRVAGMYVMEPYRKGRAALGLLSRTIAQAQRLYPPETEVTISAINRDAFSLCDKLLLRSAARSKETELLSVYYF